MKIYNNKMGSVFKGNNLFVSKLNGILKENRDRSSGCPNCGSRRPPSGGGSSPVHYSLTCNDCGYTQTGISSN